jgi:hypothetical protein
VIVLFIFSVMFGSFLVLISAQISARAKHSQLASAFQVFCPASFFQSPGLAGKLLPRESFDKEPNPRCLIIAEKHRKSSGCSTIRKNFREEIPKSAGLLLLVDSDSTIARAHHKWPVGVPLHVTAKQTMCKCFVHRKATQFARPWLGWLISAFILRYFCTSSLGANLRGQLRVCQWLKIDPCNPSSRRKLCSLCKKNYLTVHAEVSALRTLHCP